MGNAKVIIKQQDRAELVPSLNGINIGTVVNSKWGEVTPTLTSDPTKLVEKFGKPDNKKGSSWNGAELLLANSNRVHITRAIHEDAVYSAALVRFKIDQPNFNEILDEFALVDTVVSPLEQGIGLNDIDSFTFPLYSVNREYENSSSSVVGAGSDDKSILVSSLISDPSSHVFEAGDLVSFNVTPAPTPNDSFDYYEIESVGVEERLVHILTFSTAVSADVGDEILKSTGLSFSPKVFVTKSAVDSNELVVDGHDDITNNEQILISNQDLSAAVLTKILNNTEVNIIKFLTPVSVQVNSRIYWMKTTDFEYRDSFLAVAKCPGDMGNRIKVGIRKSINYAEGFWLDVYFDGVKEESFECSRDPFIDGFGNQMYVETKVNGISKYLTIVDNVADTGRALPLETNYGVWRQNSKDLFKLVEYTFDDTNTAPVLSVEDIVANDTNLRVNNTSVFNTGRRIKIGSPDSEEYKILEISGFNLVLDRPFIPNRLVTGAKIYMFNPDLTDEEAGVYEGVQYYKFSKIAMLPNYSIGDQYKISAIYGEVLDSGSNGLAGGFDGSAITVYDVIEAFNKMNNKEKYNISVFCDNGFAYPEVANAIDGICKLTNLSHGYLSTPYNAELSSEPVTAVVNYRNSTNLNSEFISMFTGWIEVTDVYNQTKVWVAPSVMGVNTQSFVTRNYYMFTPAAGWVYGRVDGLNIGYKFTDGERDALIEAQLNPIRHREGWGLAVWGNETMLVKPGPLQLRSVAMLLIILKYGLENYLEYKLFAMNNEPTWTEVENAISIFIRDTLFTPGGLYAYQVSVKKIITDTDIDNRRMPIFVGIQPTMDIKEIPVTLGIFNKSVSIAV